MLNKRREELKKFRILQKLTQQEMADKLGISLIQYQFIELGRRNPSFSLLVTFMKLFPKANIIKIFFN